MKITVTGTPGTGKTSVAERLEGYEKIHLTEFVKNHRLGEDADSVFEVDVERMVEKVEEVTDDNNWLIEGHLAHHVPSDICVVLRCNPEELEERLEERDYSSEKINENSESEAMDLILQEALQTQEKVIEIDTTGKTAEETVSVLKEKIEEGNEDYGNVDWSDSL